MLPFNESPVVGCLDDFHFFAVTSNTVVDTLVSSSLFHAVYYYNELLEVPLLQQKVFVLFRLRDTVFHCPHAL